MPLKVTSRPIELAGLPTGDFLFARSNQTLIGQGVALRLSAKGKDRIASLAKKWQEVCAEAEILDGVKALPMPYRRRSGLLSRPS